MAFYIADVFDLIEIKLTKLIAARTSSVLRMSYMRNKSVSNYRSLLHIVGYEVSKNPSDSPQIKCPA